MSTEAVPLGLVRQLALGRATHGEVASVGIRAEPHKSDVDFLVELDPPMGMSRFDAYFGPKEALEGLLGRPVGLVGPSVLANPYFADAIERTREPLYADATIDDQLVWRLPRSERDSWSRR